MKKLSYLSFALVALGLCLLAAQDVWGQGQNFPGSGGTGAGVSSLSGDANIFCNSSGTGAVTLTDCTPVNLPSGATLNATPFASGATANISNYCPLAGCTFTGALSGTSVTLSASLTLTGDGVHAGSSQNTGNTTSPTINSNVTGWMGPNATSFTSYLFRPPSTAPSGSSLMLTNTPASNIAPVTYLPAASGLLSGSGGVFSLSGDTNHTYSSGTQTSGVTTQNLCSTTYCVVGNYLITMYANETGTGCTTVGSGAVKVELSYTNNQGTAESAVVINQTNSATTAFGTTGMSLTTTGTGAGYGIYYVNTNGSAAITVTTVVTACTTPGTWTGYQVRLTAVPIS